MRKAWIILAALLLALAVNSFALSPAFKATAAPETANEVHVDFLTTYRYEIYEGDVFINGEVTGKMDWHTRIVNTPDQTGAVVKDLKVTLASPDNGALLNEWSYGDVPEGPSTCWTPDAVYFGDIKHHPCTFTPGFDVSLSIDKTVFTAPDTQTVTITVTPRDERVTDHLDIEVVAPRGRDDLVDPVIISHTGEGEFELSPEGDVFGIWRENLELNTPWSIDVTLRITPNVTNKVTKVEYRPGVPIGAGVPEESSGTTTGSSVSYTNEAGTWTVGAEGDYIWNWTAKSPSGYTVGFDRIVNAAPQLMEGKVTATSGLLKETFNFEVNYADYDSPSYVRVYVDGSAKDMKYARGGERGWPDPLVFSYTAALSPGQHTYYFEASDGSLIARFPQDGTLTIEVTSQRFFIWIIVGAVAAGLGIYFFRRRRRKVV